MSAATAAAFIVLHISEIARENCILIRRSFINVCFFVNFLFFNRDSFALGFSLSFLKGVSKEQVEGAQVFLEFEPENKTWC